MKRDYNYYWENCWKEGSCEELYKYLEKYCGMESEEIAIFKEHNIVNICDAACTTAMYRYIGTRLGCLLLQSQQDCR